MNILDEAKLNWAFKVYDVDNDGSIDIDNIADIIQTLDALEGFCQGLVISQYYQLLIECVLYSIDISNLLQSS